MLSFCQFLLWLLVCSTCYYNLNATILTKGTKYHQHHEAMFKRYIDEFGKKYTKSSSEYAHKYENFLASVKRIQKRNEELFYISNHSNAIYGLNQFSDLSQKEFQEKYLSFISVNKSEMQSVSTTEQNNFNIDKLPKKLDWRQKGIVTPVKNQGQCGSCWAFSAVEAVESAWAKSKSQLIQLSTQQVIDCSSNNSGCKGGYPYKAMSWIKNNHVKIVKSEVYPYHDKRQTCINESASIFGVGVSQYFHHSCRGPCPLVERKEMLPHLYSSGPLSIIVDAISWQDYNSGIIQHHCSFDAANHAVQIVGYDLTGDVPFWIVRNSWGKKFGDQGYLYIKIGENLCGVANSYSGVASVFGGFEA